MLHTVNSNIYKEKYLGSIYKLTELFIYQLVYRYLIPKIMKYTQGHYLKENLE